MGWLGFAALWLSFVADVTGWAVLRVWLDRRARLRRRATTETGISPKRILCIRPCAGEEPGLEVALASTALLDPSKNVTLRFAVESKEDRAFPVAEAMAMRLSSSGHDAAVVVTRASALNRKAAQLERVLSLEPIAPDVVVVADSDVQIGAEDLDALLSTLSRPGVGVAWSAPIETAPATMADRASAAVLDGSLHAFALLAVLDRSTLVGKLFAIRRDTLERVGGFGSLVEHLGEDSELARRVTALGLAVEASGAQAFSIASGRTWRDVIARYTRWLWVIRSQRPLLLAAYPLLFVPWPFIVALALVPTHSETPGRGAMLVGAAIGWRLVTALLSRWASGSRMALARLPIDVLLGDLLLGIAFVRLWTTRTVRWRHRDLSVGPPTARALRR